MAKIAIDARELGGSGTGRYIEKLLRYLQALDHENDYIVLLKPKQFGSWKPSNQRFTKVQSPFKEFTFSEQFGLWRQLKKIKPDLVHFPMVQQPVLYKGKVVTTMNDLTTVRFRNPTKNPLVFTLKQSVYRWLNKHVAHKSDALITFTEFVKNDVAKFTKINGSKVTVINLAAEELEEKASAISALDGKDFLMYSGRPLPHKNLRRAIEALKILHKNHPGLTLAIIGKKDASYTSYISLINKLRLSDYVIFTDFIPNGQLKWAFANTKAYIFPSLSEGFGLPGLEAMYYGAPVISSNATCLPEVYGDAAYYFDPTNVNDIADKINDVLDSTKIRQELKEKGKERVKKYSWEKMTAQTLHVYKKVLDS